MSSFSWLQHPNINKDPNWQVRTFTKTFLNIMSNFVPNEVKRILPSYPLQTTTTTTKTWWRSFVKNASMQLTMPNYLKKT